MQVLDRASGQYFDFPDHATDQDIINTFEGARQQTQGGSFAPLAQQFMQGMQQPIAQQIAQGPQRSTLPNIGGGAMVGLNPQQAQFVLGQAQQSNVDSMAERQRQQQMVQQGLESEKDRQQTLKLRQQELKNAVSERKLEMDAAKFEAEQKAKVEMLKEKNANSETIARLNKPISVSEGGALVDPVTGLETYRNPKTYAPESPEAPRWQPDTIQMVNPETGKLEDVRVFIAPGQQPQVIGPAPRKETQTKDTSLTPVDRVRAVSDMVKQMMNDQTENGITPDSPEYMTRDQMVQHAQEFVDMVSGTKTDSQQSFGPKTPTPDQEYEMSQIRQAGGQVMFDPETGEVIVRGK